jgi:hypothetical protein
LYENRIESMNENKICFITCVNDEVVYEESVYYINHLTIPVGVEIEFIAIRGASCLTKAYNEALQSSDAKYKVYLHQDVFIVNKNFILDIFHIFQRDKTIGMIGVAGAKQLPVSACWWETNSLYIGIYDTHQGYIGCDQFGIFTDTYEEVAAVDGLIMITQHDIPWREDLFDGWHFYDISQSVEFTKKGYQVVVPKQVEPWCIHDCGITVTGEPYEKYRNIFLDEYSTYLFPLVSIVIIVSDHPELFPSSFENAMQQFYRNIEIVILDFTNNKDVKKYMNFYLNNKKVKFFQNDISKIMQCKGEYIYIVEDNEVFDKNKIMYMIHNNLDRGEIISKEFIMQSQLEKLSVNF